MPERYTDQQLEAVLASVGRHLAVPTGSPEVASLPARAAARRPGHTALLVAAAVAVLVLVAGAVVTPVREAVADWLGIGSTRIERVRGPEGDPRGLPVLAAEAVPVSRAVARAQLGGVLPVVRDDRLGTPTLSTLPREGGVVMVWPRGKTTLWVHREPGDGVTFVKKLLNIRDRVSPVPGLGELAARIEGEHVLETPARRVASGRVVIWVADGLEYRLESELPAAEMVEIARSVSAASP
jgi:hypothetical protein